jgi:hypothetical protein
MGYRFQPDESHQVASPRPSSARGSELIGTALQGSKRYPTPDSVMMCRG